ncbi:MAG: BTAD domain-containing putative transcriptional regulator [Stackebrandtia sp.]
MKFEVLGPLSVVGESGPVALNAAKQRLLLALLLAHSGEPVSADRLCDALWGDDPPQSERKRLAWHVNRLRRALDGVDRIAWDNRGYSIALAPGELDAEDFERLCREGSDARDRPERSAELLGEALALWRGPAYGDLAAEAFLHAEANRLDELRLSGLERRIEAELALGRHDRLVSELTALVAEHPEREKFAAQLMLALYRDGRQADALRVYQDTRTRLIEDFGLDPGPELREREQAVLRNDPALDLPTSPAAAGGLPAPAELPADVATFTGRGDEVDRLCTLLTNDVPAPVVISAISGIGGVGKSALAVHVARKVAERFPDGQLYANLHGATPEVEPLQPAEVLTRFLRSLGVDAPPDAAGVDELASRFRSATAGKRLLVMLDDARGVAQIRPLLPGESGCVVVVTSRATLAAFDEAEHHRIDVLSAADAAALLRRLIGRERADAEPDAVAAVAELCGRLPLGLCIAAARLRARPDWRVGELAQRLEAEHGRLGELDDAERAVRSSFMVSYRELAEDDDGDACRMFRLLGLLDCADASVGVAAALADVSEAEAEALLRTLVDVQLVESNSPGRYRMHDLVRLFSRERAVDEDSEAQRAQAVRRATHRYLATARKALSLHGTHYLRHERIQLGPQNLDCAPIALADGDEARSWISGESGNLRAVANQATTSFDDGPLLAAAFTAVAGPLLLDLGHWREQAELCEIATLAADQTQDQACQYFAYHDAAFAHRRFASHDRALSSGERALALSRAQGRNEWESLALTSIGTIHRRAGNPDKAADYMRQSLVIRRYASTLIELGLVYNSQKRYDEAADVYRQAVETARRTDSVVDEIVALGNLGYVLWRAGRAREAVPQFERALSIDAATGKTGTVFESDHFWGLGEVLHDLGEEERARECWNRSASILHGLNLVSAEEKHAIETSSRPEMPAVHKA